MSCDSCDCDSSFLILCEQCAVVVNGSLAGPLLKPMTTGLYEGIISYMIFLQSASVDT